MLHLMWAPSVCHRLVYTGKHHSGVLRRPFRHNAYAMIKIHTLKAVRVSAVKRQCASYSEECLSAHREREEERARRIAHGRAFKGGGHGSWRTFPQRGLVSRDE
jgi:hypothetical protein